MRADTQQAAVTCCETLGIRETARRLGVNHESVRNWAAGRSDPSDTNATAMRALAKALDMMRARGMAEPDDTRCLHCGGDTRFDADGTGSCLVCGSLEFLARDTVPSHCVGTVYANGGFDVSLCAINAQNEADADEQVRVIQHRLGWPSHQVTGYIGPDGRQYERLPG